MRQDSLAMVGNTFILYIQTPSLHPRASVLRGPGHVSPDEGTRTGRAPACPKSQLFTGAELLTNPRRRSRPPGRRSPGRYLWLLLITQLSAVAAQRRMIKYYPHRLSSRSTAAAHRRRRSRHRPTCSHLASPAPGRWVWQAARRSVFVEGLTD